MVFDQLSIFPGTMCVLTVADQVPQNLPLPKNLSLQSKGSPHSSLVHEARLRNTRVLSTHPSMESKSTVATETILRLFLPSSIWIELISKCDILELKFENFKILSTVFSISLSPPLLFFIWLQRMSCVH